MRTYGLDSVTGKWTLLTQGIVTGPPNPITTPIRDVLKSGSTITSTLYTTISAFIDSDPNGSLVNVAKNDVLLNDKIFDANNNLLSSFWSDLTQNVAITTPPLTVNIAQQIGGSQSFFNNWGLSQGETVIVDAGYIWLTALVQTLRLTTGESPFYGNYGIPGQEAVMTQVAPDVALNRTQAQYAPFFASLTIVRQQNASEPTYNVYATFQNGTKIQTIVAT